MNPDRIRIDPGPSKALRTDQARLIPHASVPFYGLLRDSYREWVPLFLKGQVLKVEIEGLEKQLAAIRNEPMSADDMLRYLQPLHQAATQRRIQQLAEKLKDFQHPATTRDPFESVELFLKPMGRLTDLMTPVFSWEEVEAAVKSLPPGAAQSTRERRMGRLTEQSAKLKAELSECQPGGRFMWNAGKPLIDSWTEFVRFWEDVQGKLTGPCGPQGALLEHSPEDEKWAWKELGLSNLVNPKGRMHPHPHPLMI